MLTKPELTLERLRKLLSYDEAADVFTNRVSRGPAKAGDVAGCINKTLGYRVIRIDGQLYYASRLAVFYVTGEWPPAGMEVDHISRRRDDDRFANLRVVTPGENLRNKGRYRNNTSGHPGVRWIERLQKWQVRISKNRRRIHLGYFTDYDEAVRVRRAAELEYFGAFAPSHSNDNELQGIT